MYQLQSSQRELSKLSRIAAANRHLVASIMAYIKLEKLKFVNKMNHFALKNKIYIQALKAAFNELTDLKQQAHV